MRTSCYFDLLYSKNAKCQANNEILTTAGKYDIVLYHIDWVLYIFYK